MNKETRKTENLLKNINRAKHRTTRVVRKLEDSDTINNLVNNEEVKKAFIELNDMLRESLEEYTMNQKRRIQMRNKVLKTLTGMYY